MRAGYMYSSCVCHVRCSYSFLVTRVTVRRWISDSAPPDNWLPPARDTNSTFGVALEVNDQTVRHEIPAMLDRNGQLSLEQ